MGKRLLKKELLAEIKLEREQLVELIKTVKRNQFNVPGINTAQWSIKDVLTHLADWEVRTVGWCVSGKSGEKPEVPGDGFKWNQTKELNALIQKRHARKSIKKVLEEFEQAHQATLKLIDALSDRELTTIGHFDWTGKSWTVSDYLLGNTANHYRWARKKIHKWLSQLETSL